MHRGIAFIFLWLVVATLAILAPRALAQSPSSASSGVVEGRVTDGATGEALPGARLAIPGSAIETSTDRQGMFRLTGVPAGQQTILVSYLGRRDETVDVDVTAGSARRLDVNLGANKFEESVTVQAELIRDAQARALNQQKTAPNITNVVSADQIGSFPDRERRRDRRSGFPASRSPRIRARGATSTSAAPTRGSTR